MSSREPDNATTARPARLAQGKPVASTPSRVQPHRDAKGKTSAPPTPSTTTRKQPAGTRKTPINAPAITPSRHRVSEATTAVTRPKRKPSTAPPVASANAQKGPTNAANITLSQRRVDTPETTPKRATRSSNPVKMSKTTVQTRTKSASLPVKAKTTTRAPNKSTRNAVIDTAPTNTSVTHDTRKRRSQKPPSGSPPKKRRTPTPPPVMFTPPIPRRRNKGTVDVPSKSSVDSQRTSDDPVSHWRQTRSTPTNASTADTAQKDTRNRPVGLGKGRERTMRGSHSTTAEENTIPLETLSITEQTRGKGVEESKYASQADAMPPSTVPGVAGVSGASDREDPQPGEKTIEAAARRIPLIIPEGHKLVHIMRHATAWHK
jgi:hypothetical protein